MRYSQTTSTSRSSETEDQLHKRVVKWLDGVLPPKSLYHHSPNEGIRHVNHKVKLKALGTKFGWPDLEIYCPQESFKDTQAPIFIELKRPKGGRLSDSQKELRDQLTELGCYWFLARSLCEMHDALSEILWLEHSDESNRLLEEEQDV